MRIAALMTVLVLGIQASAEEPKVEWTKASSDKGKFEAQFPGKPTDMSKAPNIQMVLEAEGGKVALLVNSTVLPAKIDITDKDVVKKMLDGGTASIKKAFANSKVISEKEAKFADKFPGKDLDLEIPGLGIYRTKWVVTSEAFIQIVVLGPKDYVDGPIAKKFFESLKVKE